MIFNKDKKKCSTIKIDEADKVITDKDERITELKAENESLLQQNHELCQALQVMYGKEEYDKQKYKRCLAMAMWCFNAGCKKQSNYKLKTFFWSRWGNRWWKLAEKFKEAK